MPYSRADVVFWPDEEEVDAWRHAALVAVDAAATEPPLMPALMYAADRAAAAASIAAAQVSSHSLRSPERQHDGNVSQTHKQDAIARETP